MNRILKILITVMSIISIISCSNSNNKTNNSNTAAENTSGVIRVATPGAYPIFSEVNDNGELQGYDIDIWEEIGRRLGKKVEWTQVAMDGCFGALDAGKVDSVTQQISITKARMEKYYFSEPYFLSPYKLYVPGTNSSINKFEDMYGKKLALALGSAAHEYIKRLDPEGKIEIVSFRSDSLVTLPNNVANGKADASIQSVVTFDDRIKKTGLDLKLVGDVVYTEVNAFPFRKDEEGKKLCDDVSKTLLEMREDGTLENIAVKWFGYNPMEGLDFQAELEKLLATF
ncbi:transporter substrate-binding domain-containing protein [uncultured Brachyspira sp.]|uniref:transporter substrate-binding domain-containing protein n=1 Tax=uncultured Brachyspira sp. TaxID=221953 RepID=UPI00261C1E44|nr:transporter substrate-binding domain-containing protein [uncultured Brachyspira sp.]